MPTYFTTEPSPGPPKPPRSASPDLSPGPAPQDPAGRRERSRGPAERPPEGPAKPRARAVSSGSSPPRCRQSEAPRDPGADHRRYPLRAETSGGRGTGKTRTYHAGRQHRSPASARACGGAARVVAPSGRETLAPSRATPLQDRAARARRHTRSKPVPPLTTADVRLIGAFHVVGVGECAAGGARSIDDACPEVFHSWRLLVVAETAAQATP
jgi:hypothetical protein